MKRTPLEEYSTVVEKLQTARLDAEERAVTDAENTIRAETDRRLSFDERLALFKSLQAWPRIVLGIYDAELAAAQKDRKENGAPEYGRELPSEMAHETVAEVLGLTADRIRQICREGRRHLRQGLPPKRRIRAAVFRHILSGGAAKTALPREG